VSKIVLHNAARVAEVWMDEWRDFYYAMNPGLTFDRYDSWELRSNAVFFLIYFFSKSDFLLGELGPSTNSGTTGVG
jgi:hypothetical protein